ncbi:MAG: hypothetical protein C0599_10265 [Salinivirgaceae bacterium]|nr:MAG: hypothetical protein C0599_10265 [Salinivirgaceae bacterium]
MKKLIVILLFWQPFICFAQQWDAVNENHEAVSFIEFFPRIYFGSNESIFVQDDDQYVELFYNLEVTDGVRLDDSCILATIGSGTYSDAVYKVNLYTGMSEVMEYFYKPQVIEKHNDTYFCGFWGGIAKSQDGYSWSNVHTMQTDSVISNIFFDDNKVIAIGNFNNTSFILRSEDDGPFEFIGPLLLPCHAAAYDLINHKLYLGVYDMSDSDGLYVSNDYGNSFELVRYMDSINAIYVVNDNLLGIGIANHSDDYNGIYLYNIETDILSNVSGNLPNKNVSNITINPFINCINIIACTPDGAYISCDALTGNETIEPHFENIQIYPNPTHNKITVSINIEDTGDYMLKVLNVSGKLIHEEGFNGLKGELKTMEIESFKDLNAGMYFIQIMHGNQTVYNQKIIKY